MRSTSKLIFVALFAAAASPLALGDDSPHGDLRIDCQSCHTTGSWRPLRQALDFRHGDTGFPLTGLHAAAGCRDCHDGLVFSHVGTACLDCHADPHRGELGALCGACHDPRRWDNQRPMFDAHGETLFPLLAAHAPLDCDSCHGNQQPFEFATTPIECFPCHSEDYARTTNPDHGSAGFSTDCLSCHLPLAVSWQGVAFQHPASFPLAGGHRLDCSACHAGGFTALPTECFFCHADDFGAAADPDHARASFPTACKACHSIDAWRPASFEHDQTGFALRGGHAALDCQECHAGGFTATSVDCYGCHAEDYNATRDPDHRAAGFSTACQNCHGDDAWTPATDFDHSGSRFPLTGAHAGLDCNSCHAAGFAGTPTACNGCHAADFDAARDPDHRAAGFPRTCETCHGTSAWSPATDFDHSLSRFPLTGRHVGLECTACHASGYAGTPTDCYSCHTADYDRAGDPNHRAAGFPTTCQDCHGTNGWEGASFDHDGRFFPIYSGEHRGEWNACSDCHTAPSSYAVFSCLGCHEHRRSEMDDEHRGINGYVYESRACLDCHPDGRE